MPSRPLLSRCVAGVAVVFTVAACAKNRLFLDEAGPPATESAANQGGTPGDAAPAGVRDCTDAGCERPLTCDPSSRLCPQCSDDADCEPDAPICAFGTLDGQANRCVECTSDVHCGAERPACDLNTHQCTARCDSSIQCPPEVPLCNVPTQTCVGCLSGADCLATAGLCDPYTARCVDCLGTGPSAECQSITLSRCQNGFCQICINDTDCELFADAPDNAPACKSGTGCVECVSNTHCTDPDTPVCKTAEGGASAAINTCVECITNADCQTNAAASLCQNNECVPCVADTDCDGVDSNGNQPGGTNLTVCDAGTCVECTGLRREACGTNVCDSRAKTCSLDRSERGAGMCADCVSDDECPLNARCVQAATLGVGFFCVPVQVDALCPNSGDARGFLERQTVATIDDRSEPVCLPDATCPAFVNYRDGTPCEGASDDDTCGQGGSCALQAATGSFFCTTSCDTPGDCVRGTCNDDLCTL